MTSISNMKIGRKIILVLGGIVLLLMGLSALSLWGAATNEKLAVAIVQQLTKAQLAETITSDTSEIGVNVEAMIIGRKASEDLAAGIAARKKSRAEALEEFR